MKLLWSTNTEAWEEWQHKAQAKNSEEALFETRRAN